MFNDDPRWSYLERTKWWKNVRIQCALYLQGAIDLEFESKGTAGQFDKCKEMDKAGGHPVSIKFEPSTRYPRRRNRVDVVVLFNDKEVERHKDMFVAVHWYDRLWAWVQRLFGSDAVPLFAASTITGMSPPSHPYCRCRIVNED